jgi:hypothetical protein
MTRTLVGLAALTLLVAAPAVAQQSTPAAAAPRPAEPAVGSEEWLRQRGETYHSAPESEQDPAEVAATAKLNEGISARNTAAAETEAADQARYDTENQRWREDTARADTARVQWEADVAAAAAAQAQWERDRAAYDARVAACRATGRQCIVTPQ